MHREDIRGPHKGEVRLSGWFYPNGASAPTAFDKSWISSIAHAATGKWTITMKDDYGPFNKLIALHVCGRDTGNVGYFQPGVVSSQVVGSAPCAILVEFVDPVADALADVAAHADSICYVDVVLKYGVAPDGTEL